MEALDRLVKRSRITRKTALRRDGPGAQRFAAQRSTLTRKPLRARSAKMRTATAPADKAWADEVKRRADHQCQAAQLVPEVACQGILEADHIVPKGRRPDLRHDLDNGQALCSAHHAWKHAHTAHAKVLGLAR